jgi:UrcA family protein
MTTSTFSSGLRTLVATAIFGAFLSIFSAGSAADPLSSASVTVTYADLNIASASGALVLYQRIRAAAISACSYFLFERDEDEARCVQNTTAKAVVKVNQPALSAIYDARSKASPTRALLSQRR